MEEVIASMTTISLVYMKLAEILALEKMAVNCADLNPWHLHESSHHTVYMCQMYLNMSAWASLASSIGSKQGGANQRFSWAKVSPISPVKKTEAQNDNDLWTEAFDKPVTIHAIHAVYGDICISWTSPCHVAFGALALFPALISHMLGNFSQPQVLQSQNREHISFRILEFGSRSKICTIQVVNILITLLHPFLAVNSEIGMGRLPNSGLSINSWIHTNIVLTMWK